MSTSTFAENTVHRIREWKEFAPAIQPHSISAMTSVRADRHRIFQALTVPEYIETWFSAPGAIAGRTDVVARQDFFSISYTSRLGDRFSVFCSYKMCRRSKLLFTWEHNAVPGASPSLVRIRLLGDFGRSTVHVTHLGLAQSDLQWHQELWRSSLEKLQILL
jgi:uncharacterized protein YndB with AHSA1/START domain